MLCLGAFATIAQVLLLREIFVALHGNELSLATALACWLLGVGMGAMIGRTLAPRCSMPMARRGVGLCLLLLGIALPLQLGLGRSLRLVLGVGPGEYAPLIVALAGFAAVLLPSALLVGASFPFACRAGHVATEASGQDQSVMQP